MGMVAETPSEVERTVARFTCVPFGLTCHQGKFKELVDKHRPVLQQFVEVANWQWEAAFGHYLPGWA